MKVTMKKISIVLLLIIVTISCHKEMAMPPFGIAEMQKAIKQNPDSVANVLEGKINTATLSGQDKADYWFLLAQTHLQQGRSLINDSLIHFTVEYYKANNSPYLSFAYRLAAYQINWLGDKNVEQERLSLEALEIAENKTDTIEIIRTYRVLAVFYTKVKEHSKTISAYKKIIELSSSLEAKSESMHLIGIQYAVLEEKDSCFLYLDNAAKIAKEHNYPVLYDILRNYADCLNYFDNSKKAIEVLNQTNQLSGNVNKISKYYANFTYLNAWLNLNQLDSAKVYIDYLQKANTKVQSTDAEFFVVNFMTEMFRSIYNEKKGLSTEMLTMGLHGDDVINSIRNNINIDKELIFIQNKLAKEKDRLEVEKAQQLQVYLLIIIALLLITGIIIFIYQRKVLQKERAIQLAKERLQQHTIKLYENENIIRQNEILIKDLTSQIEENNDSEERLTDIEQIVEVNKSLQKQNDLLNEEINKYSTLLDETGENKVGKRNIALQEREKFLLDQLITNHGVLSKLKYSPRFIKEEQWPVVINTINVLYNNFAVRLQAEYPTLTEEDIRYCSLMELRLTTSTIGILMAVSATSVSKRKQRIKEKMSKKNRELFSKQSLENYLWNY
jgi:hypothetical protein